MLTRTTRRLALLGLVLGLAALVRVWSDKPSTNDGASQSSTAEIAPKASATAPRRPDTVVESIGSPGTPRATSAMERSREVSGPSVRLHVHAPAAVQAGQVFEARIDVEASGGIRQLLFAVRYAKSRLALVGWSEGDFAQRGVLPAEFGAQEPSDGNIEVTFNVANGLSVAGAGNLAVLQFEAIRVGTSEITLGDFTVVDEAGGMHRNVAIVQEGSVTIY